MQKQKHKLKSLFGLLIEKIDKGNANMKTYCFLNEKGNKMLLFILQSNVPVFQSPIFSKNNIIIDGIFNDIS